ncbi:MAG: DUF169 domain-containing protein [Dehalococcoidia bacterium]|nr:DUF169 domain-containing protein [Dehalococcoidia bacterium]
MSWADTSNELINTLKLKTDPVAFRRLKKAEDLDQIRNVRHIPYLFTFCQAVFLARVEKWTIGITKQDQMNIRCMRLHGVRHASEKSMQGEAQILATTWFATPEEAFQQQLDSPRVPVAEAVVLSPLGKGEIEPEVVLIFGNPAQLMMLMCGLQKEKYERFDFHFIGEGACADSLAECYITQKPQLSVPCWGERAIGQVADDEIAIALPPSEIGRALSGMQKLAKVGFKYPISFIGAQADIQPVFSQIYPDAFK